MANRWDYVDKYTSNVRVYKYVFGCVNFSIQSNNSLQQQWNAISHGIAHSIREYRKEFQIKYKQLSTVQHTPTANWLSAFLYFHKTKISLKKNIAYFDEMCCHQPSHMRIQRIIFANIFVSCSRCKPLALNMATLLPTHNGII